MNHLPTVADPAVGAIEIPYHGSEYQSASFYTYPTSQGLSVDDVLIGGVPDAKNHLETWFYFGMLCEVLGPVNQNRFLCAGTSGDRILNTVCLEEYTILWWRKLKACSTQGRKDGLSKAHRCIAFVFERLHYGRSCIRAQELLDPRFLLAIQILGSSLSYAVAKFAAQRNIIWHQKLPSQEMQIFWPTTNTFVDDKMLEAGWCPNEVERFKMMLSPLTQLYALGLRRPSKSKHESCTPFECKANDIDTAKYRTAHVQAECQCQFLSVDVDAIKEILEKDVPRIPLIEIKQKSGSAIELKVVEHHSNKRYVAISHVWSDGMGNCDQNALPQCQLTKIWDLGGHLLRDPSHMALSSDDRVNPFVLGAAHLWHAAPNILGIDKGVTTIWIDTLCIPLEDKPRKIAIRGMKDVYEKAHRVMVLDSELLSSDHITKQETMLRIITCSGWMRRLWTFQEAVFAHQRAYVYFKNTAIRIPYIADRLSLEHSRGNFPLFSEPVIYDSYGHWLAGFRMLEESLSSYKRVENLLFRQTKDPCYLIALVWDTVMGRTTSKETDRPVIMASLLGLDTAKILEVPAEALVKDTGEVVPGGPAERMRKLYEMMPRFPQSSIFQYGERFPEQGWRWAVTSCKYDVGNGGTQARLGDTPGRILLPYGLLVNFPGQVVRRQDISVVHAPPSHNGISKEYPLLLVSDDSFNHRIYIDVQPLDFTEVYANSRYGIGLLYNTKRRDQSWEHIFKSDVQQTKQLLMVSIYKEEKGTLYSRFEGRVTAWRSCISRGWIHGICQKAVFVDGQQGWWVG